jgi:hypothetical protein
MLVRDLVEEDKTDGTEEQIVHSPLWGTFCSLCIGRRQFLRPAAMPVPNQGLCLFYVAKRLMSG